MVSLERLHESAGERVADHVRLRLQSAILAGDLRPGERLSVPELARQLGVSRSPVREAVLNLVNIGLAVEEPRRGARVAGWTKAQLLEVYELRCALEGLAAGMAAQRIGAAELEQLRANIVEHAEMVATGNLERHIELDQEFHEILRNSAGNAELQAVLDSLRLKVRAAMATTVVTAGPDLALADHRAIYAAVEARDADEAEGEARQHIQRLLEALNEDLE